MNTRTAAYKQLRPVYDLSDEIQSLDYVDECQVICDSASQEGGFTCDGQITIRIHPQEGGITNKLRGKVKDKIRDVAGLYLNDFSSPRQQHGKPHKGQDLEEFYEKHPYHVEFSFDGRQNSDGTGQGDLRKESSSMHPIKKVAARFLIRQSAFDVSTPLEKTIGYAATRQLGFDDLGKAFFEDVKDELLEDNDYDTLEDVNDGIRDDDDDTIAEVMQTVVGVADDRGLID